MVGIYKITNPSGKVYIGQSIDIEKRFKRYNKLHCKQQYKLYNSLKKYGVENHIFEVIEECEINQLNNRERYWQENYNVIGRNGLNLSLTATDIKRKVYTQEIIEKISNSQKGKSRPFYSEEALNNSKATRFQKGSTVNNKKVINIETGEIYESAKILAEKLGICAKLLRARITSKSKTIKKYLYLENIEKKQLICCYGTLRKGFGNHRLLKNARYLGTFNSEPIYNLHNLGGFPGLKHNGNTSVVMEVYKVTPEEAYNVDCLEGYDSNEKPTFYDKEIIETPFGKAGVYIYVDSLDDCPLVESGDYYLHRFGKVSEEHLELIEN